MSAITVIGLGMMGAALARAVQRAGHDLTVWNRNPARMQPFVDDGVAGAANLGAAIMASPVVLICIDNYAVTDAILRPEAIAALLSGRTVVQLSTGAPREAAEASRWMTAQGAAYLDGAILCGPTSIATDDARILLSGSEVAYGQAGSLLECLGGSVRYLGANVGAAAALDLAWLTTCYGRFVAIAHAANMCASENVGLDEFMSLFPDNPEIRDYAKVIHEQSFHESTATLHVWNAALERIRQQGIDANINTEFPDFVAGIFKRAVNAGYGQDNVMSLLKVLQDYAGK